MWAVVCCCVQLLDGPLVHYTTHANNNVNVPWKKTYLLLSSSMDSGVRKKSQSMAYCLTVRLTVNLWRRRQTRRRARECFPTAWWWSWRESECCAGPSHAPFESQQCAFVIWPNRFVCQMYPVKRHVLTTFTTAQATSIQINFNCNQPYSTINTLCQV